MTGDFNTLQEPYGSTWWLMVGSEAKLFDGGCKTAREIVAHCLG
jgi:hypothetical protein